MAEENPSSTQIKLYLFAIVYVKVTLILTINCYSIGRHMSNSLPVALGVDNTNLSHQVYIGVQKENNLEQAPLISSPLPNSSTSTSQQVPSLSTVIPSPSSQQVQY